MKPNKYLLLLILSILLLGGFLNQVMASNFGLQETEPRDIRLVIVDMINSFLKIVALVFLVVVIAGAALYMLSRGDPEKKAKVKKYFISAFIGLLIILVAFAAVSFILKSLVAGSTRDIGYAASDGVYDSKDATIVTNLIKGIPVTCLDQEGQEISCKDVYDFNHDGYMGPPDLTALRQLMMK